MRYPFFISLLLFTSLQGCMLSPTLSPDIQNRWQARPINELTQQLGPASETIQQNNQTKYIWRKSEERRVTIAPGQKQAGLKMANGKNIATTIKGSPIKNLQTVSCQVIAITDSHNQIIEMQQTSNGLSCYSLTSSL